ncbi:hypothetical protein EG68_03349, partial [Paragonimus skrjabini miyazakii]
FNIVSKSHYFDPATKDTDKDLVHPNETHFQGVPFFIQHPKPLYYTMKDHPAIIECIAEPVSHAVIECAEQAIPYKGPDESGRLKVTRLDFHNRPDPNGNRWHLELQIRAKEVEEWFDSYVCRCEAWNKIVELQRPKKVLSQETIVTEACKTKTWISFNQISLRNLIIFFDLLHFILKQASGDSGCAVQSVRTDELHQPSETNHAFTSSLMNTAVREAQTPPNPTVKAISLNTLNGSSLNHSSEFFAVFKNRTSKSRVQTRDSDETESSEVRYESCSSPLSTALYQELVQELRLPENEANVTCCGHISADGGRLSLDKFGVYVSIPAQALVTNLTQEVRLALIQNVGHQPQLNGQYQQLMLSPVIQLGPPNLKLTKPAVVVFQHCAPMASTSLSILLFTKRLIVDSTNRQPAVSVLPRKENETITFDNGNVQEMRTPSSTRFTKETLAEWMSVTVGDWTSNSDLDCQLLDAKIAQVTCSTSIRFCLVGELRQSPIQPNGVVQDQSSENPLDRMKVPRTRNIATLLHLVAFGGRQSINLDYNIRVYVLNYDHCTLERVIQEESQTSCHMLDQVKQFYFQANGSGLIFLLEVLSNGWRSRLPARKQVNEFFY